MNLTARTRLAVGVLTTGVAMFFGVTMYAGGFPIIGAILFGLGLLRGGLLVRDASRWIVIEDDDAEE